MQIEAIKVKKGVTDVSVYTLDRREVGRITISKSTGVAVDYLQDHPNSPKGKLLRKFIKEALLEDAQDVTLEHGGGSSIKEPFIPKRKKTLSYKIDQILDEHGIHIQPKEVFKLLGAGININSCYSLLSDKRKSRGWPAYRPRKAKKG